MTRFLSRHSLPFCVPVATTLLCSTLILFIIFTAFTPACAHLQHVDHSGMSFPLSHANSRVQRERTTNLQVSYRRPVLSFLFSPIMSTSDAEINDMNIDDLLHVEHDLRDQNARVDKHIASLHGRLDKLRQQQERLESAQRKVGAARDFEVRQRRAREKDLQRAKAEVQAKRNQVLILSQQTDKLRERIRELTGTILKLNRDKHRLEQEYTHPSLQSAFLHDAHRMGPVTEHVANKTVEVIFPELRIGLEEADHARRLLQRAPTFTSLFTSFIVYAMSVGIIWLCYRGVCTVCQRLTLARMLFSTDIGFTAVWFAVCFCYAVIVGDPFQHIASNHVGVSFVLQLTLLAALVANVALRCFNLSANICLSSVVELILVVFIAQHYYQGVWKQIVYDDRVTADFCAYFLYLIINGGLAVHRARAMGRPGDKLRVEFEEVDNFMRGNEWFYSRLSNVWRKCEDWLTNGVVEYDDVESVGKRSWKEVRRGHTRAGNTIKARTPLSIAFRR